MLIRADKRVMDDDEDPEQMIRITEHMRERYGDDIGPWDDWGWGFVNGKLSALRWVLGDE